MAFYSDFADHYEAIFPFSPAVYDFLTHYLSPPPAAVLDVGCGTGHYTERLAQDGFDAVGIDLDPAMIAYADQHYERAEFRVMNMLEIATLRREFDGAVCIGNTAAHLTQAEFARFLDQVREILVLRGIWILQVMNWDYVLEQERVAFPTLAGEGAAVFHREYREISDRYVTFVTRLEVEGETIFEETTPLYPLRSAAIAALHAGRGFRLIAHTGSYSGDPFDPNTFSANIFVFERIVG